jgi:tetratricopeptide (TPR) repeat protein
VRLRADVEGDQMLDGTERERLLVLVTSAWAATKVFETEQFRSQHDLAKTRAKSATVLRDVSDARDWIAAARDRHPEVDLDTHVQSTAIAENAFGRAAYLNGRPPGEAIAAFSRALSLAPELGDAHVNMASALLRRGPQRSDWMESVDRHLTRALEISPRDRKALYLRGQLYLRAGRPDDARKAFELAADAGDEWANLRLGELAWEAGKKKKAIALVRRSLARGPASDNRARLLVLWTAKLADEGTIERATLVAARQAGADLKRNAKRHNRKVAAPVARAISLINAKLARQHGRDGGSETTGCDDDRDAG